MRFLKSIKSALLGRHGSGRAPNSDSKTKTSSDTEQSTQNTTRCGRHQSNRPSQTPAEQNEDRRNTRSQTPRSSSSRTRHSSPPPPYSSLPTEYPPGYPPGYTTTCPLPPYTSRSRRPSTTTTTTPRGPASRRYASHHSVPNVSWGGISVYTTTSPSTRSPRPRPRPTPPGVTTGHAARTLPSDPNLTYIDMGGISMLIPTPTAALGHTRIYVSVPGMAPTEMTYMVF